MMPMTFERVNNHHGLVYTRTLADAGMTGRSLADRRTEDATACRVCSKTFKSTRGKKWCRGCGHEVCRDCVAGVIMYKSEIVSAPRLLFSRERFCRVCLFHMREHFNHKSVVDQPSHQLSLELAGVNTLQQSQITAAMGTIDDLFDRRACCSINESQLFHFMVDSDDEQEHCSPLITSSSSYCFEERGSFSIKFKTPSYDETSDLIDVARVAADQAVLLRCVYQRNGGAKCTSIDAVWTT